GLFERLAQGLAAGITVVTPNRRLAQALKAEFDSFQSDKKLSVWEDADILPFGAFVQRLYEDALYADASRDLPQLLTPAQERQLWESVLKGAALLSVAETAADCAAAWKLAHAWRIDGALDKFPGNQDAQAFAGWAREYKKRCDKEGFIDAARLPDLEFKTKKVVAYGFDILPPQVRDFLGAGVLACRPERKKSTSRKTSFPSARHELEAAAGWARARLEEGSKRIGVVIPDLEQRRRVVQRVFARAMNPGHALPDGGRVAPPFNLSLGEPLDRYPLVACALGVLELAFFERPFEEASRLLRSPFIGGAETEMLARARLDAELRKELGPRVSLAKLLSFAGPCPVLRKILENLFEKSKKKENRPPHDWAQLFTELLQAAGFPGERTPDSDEHQARLKFDEALGEFAKLGLLPGNLSAPEALRQLRRVCADTVFQPESADAPVQVVGILESAGMEFDCLWVSGLKEESWPLKARPHAFLPVALQKKAGIPEATAETSLALDRRITEGWLGAAEEVVFSWPEKDEDRDLLPSPLIAEVPAENVVLPPFVSYRELLFSARKIESISDGKAPPIKDKTIRGGTRVLTDQAACPFRAFARHRLGAEGLDAPSEGPDAMDRGILLHTLMAAIWKELGSSLSLAKDLKPIMERAAKKAVQDLGIEGRFAELEQKRLERLAAEWLEVEKGRAAFEVVQVEEKRSLAIAGLELTGRIDRMDRLADGTHALIDYKTGSRVTPNDWLGPRPDEPQLPLYAVTAKEHISAVVFGKLRRGDMKMAGFSIREKEFPGVKQALSWDGLMQGWKAEMEKLATGFAGGSAQVDPKKGLATCRNCDLQPLCRVHERLSALEEEPEDYE
ncbi:MAG TPA: PD-(D/E)XK nuclease family protein, partial [Burkholderiales bacterium]|nr:PD-(D/E)XK nuclease family protein [Burkholderiales bacterium]